MLALAALVALQAVQDPPQDGRVAAGQDRHSALLIQLSGRLDLHWLLREGAVNRAGAAIEGLPPERSSTSAWAGRISLRADVSLKDAVAGVLEIENRSFDDGLNRPFASDPERDEFALKQAYIEAGSFLSPDLALRVGVQDLTYRNRPHDEPFFMDLGESEGFHGGFSAASGGFVRNTVDRDVQEAAGARLTWAPVDFAMAQAFWVTYLEDGPTWRDESVAALFLNAQTSETFAFWLMGAVVSGGGPDLGRIWTAGAGADGYLAGKALELFGEVYLQAGELLDADRDIRRRAWAGTAGLRWVGVLDERLWLEGAAALRSGNGHADDGMDESFESYENENRFLVMQSAEFGLDVDTGVRLFRAAAGWSLADPAVRIQVDVGHFRADAPVRDAAGAPLTRERQWGTETDLTVRWAYNESLLFWVQGAWLAASAVLEDLTGGRDGRAGALVAGADLKF